MKKIIYFGVAHTFLNTSIPIIEELYKKNKIFIVINDYYLSENTLQSLRQLKKNKKIEEFIILKKDTNFLNIAFNYFKIKKSKNFFSNANFFISTDNLNSFSRGYICDQVMPLKSKTLAVILGPSNALRNSITKVVKSNLKKRLIKFIFKKKKNFIYNLFYKFKIICFFFYFNYIIKYYRIINRYLNYKIQIYFCGKSYTHIIKEDEFLKSTGISNINIRKKIDYIISDQIQQIKFLRKYCTPSKVLFFRFKNTCRCKYIKNKFKEKILSPLSFPIDTTHVVDESFISAYVKDFKIVREKTNINSIDLLLHPRQKTTWQYDLKKKLTENKFKVKILSKKKILRQILCEYKVMAGFIGTSLSDGVRFCRNIETYAFEEISHFERPNLNFKLSYGNENMNFIDVKKKISKINTKIKEKKYTLASILSKNE